MKAIGMFPYAFNFYNITSDLEASNNSNTRATKKGASWNSQTLHVLGIVRGQFLSLSLSFVCLKWR